MAFTAKRMNLLAAVTMVVAMVAVWLLTSTLQPSLTTYYLSLPALLFLWITAVARVNDIDSPGARWQIRRGGLILAVGGTVAMGLEPLYGGAYPTRGELFLLYGFVGTWLTTPNMPPWWRYVAGREANPEVDERPEGVERRSGHDRRWNA